MLEPLFDVKANDPVDGEFSAVCTNDLTTGIVTGFSSFAFGETPVTCIATDSAGNESAPVSFTVTVADNTAPRITGFPGALNPDLPQYVLDDDKTTIRIDWGPFNVQDDVTGDSDPALLVSCAVTASEGPIGPITGPTDPLYTFSYNFPAGLTEINCSATDSADNTRTASFPITVEDLTAPVIVLKGDNPLVIEAPGIYTEYGILSALDNGSIDLSSGVVIDASAVDASIPGSYPVTYRVTDCCGNEAIETRTVNVVDTTPPVIVLDGFDPQVIEAGDPYMEAGILSAADAVDGDVSASLMIDASEVDIFKVGSYTVSYTAADSATPVPNTRTVPRTVNVVDNSPPAFAPLSDITVEATTSAGATVIWDAVYATDIVDDQILATCETITGLTSGSTFDIVNSPHRVECSATDVTGNPGSQVFYVTVEDTTAPTVTAADIDIVRTDAVLNISINYITGEIIDLVPDPDTTLVPGTGNVLVSDLADPNPTLRCYVVNPDNGDDMSDTANPQHFVGYDSSTVSCSAEDASGNESSATAFNIGVSFPYGIKLILPKGQTKAGSTIPIDWQYVDSSRDPIDSGFIIPTVSWIGPFALTDSECSDDTDNSGSGNDSGSSGKRYSASSKTWQFSWQTPDDAKRYKVVISPPGADFEDAWVCIRLK
jgi:hypothetical protein